MKKVLLFIFMAILFVSCGKKDNEQDNQSNAALSQKITFYKFEKNNPTVDDYTKTNLNQKITVDYLESNDYSDTFTKFYIEGFDDYIYDPNATEYDKRYTIDKIIYTCEITFEYDKLEIGSKPIKLKVKYENIDGRKFEKETDNPTTIDTIYDELDDFMGGDYPYPRTFRVDNLYLIDTKVKYYFSKYMFSTEQLDVNYKILYYYGYKTKVYFDINDKPIMYLNHMYMSKSGFHDDMKHWPMANDDRNDMDGLYISDTKYWIQYEGSDKRVYTNDYTHWVDAPRNPTYTGTYIDEEIDKDDWYYKDRPESFEFYAGGLIKELKEVTKEEFYKENEENIGSSHSDDIDWTDSSIPTLKEPLYHFSNNFW